MFSVIWRSVPHISYIIHHPALFFTHKHSYKCIYQDTHSNFYQFLEAFFMWQNFVINSYNLIVMCSLEYYFNTWHCTFIWEKSLLNKYTAIKNIACSFEQIQLFFDVINICDYVYNTDQCDIIYNFPIFWSHFLII